MASCQWPDSTSHAVSGVSMAMLGGIVLTRAMLALWTPHARTANTARPKPSCGMSEQSLEEQDESGSAVSTGDAVDMSAPAEAAVESSDEANGSDPEVRNGRYVSGPKRGKFAKGFSGNPGGGHKPQKSGSLTKALDGIVDRSVLAKVLWNLAQGLDKNGRSLKRPNLSVQLAALQYIFDRVEGKPLQALRHEGEDLPTFIIMHGRDAAAARDAEQARAPETNGHATPVA